MARHTIYDFSIGDEVFHLSNQKIHMVVIEIGDALENPQITCRWIDKDGVSREGKFIPEELGKL